MAYANARNAGMFGKNIGMLGISRNNALSVIGVIEGDLMGLISDFVIKPVTGYIQGLLLTIAIIIVLIVGAGGMILYGSHMSAISQGTDGYFGGEVDYLGEFKKDSIGKVEFDFYRDFEFLKDADGSSTFVLDIQYPNGNWDRAKETGFGTYFRIGKQYSDYFGETKGIEFTVRDNPNNNYVAPLGVYKGYAGFFDSSGDMGNTPLDSRMLISEVYEFEFEIVKDSVVGCNGNPEGFEKCVGDTIIECVNGNWAFVKGCGWECEDDGQGNAKCVTHSVICGDGSCAPSETQYSCPEDCTPTCESGANRCENDRWMQTCVYNSYEGIYEWSRVDDCYPKKCVTDLFGTPFCKDERICTEGETKCSTDKSAILACKNNDWVTHSCDDGNPLTVGRCEKSAFGLGKPECIQERTDTCDSVNDCQDDKWWTIDKCDKSIVSDLIGGKGICSHFNISGILAVLGCLVVLGILIMVGAVGFGGFMLLGKPTKKKR